MRDAPDRLASPTLTLEGGSGVPFWSTTVARSAAAELVGELAADVAIVGGGLTGLWSAIRIADADPAARVVVVEAETVGWGASGRNGGVCDSSLTHGILNGLRHFPDEFAYLDRAGVENLRALGEFVRTEGIDCDFEATGKLIVAAQPYQVRELDELIEVSSAHGIELQRLSATEARDRLESPGWQGGALVGPDRTAIVNPAKLCQGLRRAAERRGVTVFERTRVGSVERVGGGVVLRTPRGFVRARRAVIATSAYSAWHRRLSLLFVPVYDYALVTRPLTESEVAAVRWRGRTAVRDSGNRFHYARLTADDRVLWGGYDAVYYPGSRIRPEYDHSPTTFALLAAQFREAFPALAHVTFEYGWGGPIDTTTRFMVTFGRLAGGRVVYALGYTGLGVAAARWAGGIVRDLVLDLDSDDVRLRFVRSSPLPYPPEPLRNPLVRVVKREIERADEREGRRSILLRALEAAGIGFDS